MLHLSSVFSVPLFHRCSPLQMATYRIRPVLAIIKKTSVIAFIKKSVGSLSFRPQGPKIHSLYLSQRVMRNLEFPPEISENQLKLEGLL